MRYRTSDLRIPMLYHWATETLWWARPLRSSCMTRVLHTTWVSDVDSVVFVNRIKEMVSFELGKEIEKDVFRFVCILSRACILCPSCDRVLKRIECLHCAHKHHMVSETVVVYSFQIQEQFSHYLFAICESVYVNYQLFWVEFIKLHPRNFVCHHRG